MSRLILSAKRPDDGTDILQSLAVFLQGLAVPPVKLREERGDELGLARTRVGKLFPDDSKHIAVLLVALFDEQASSALARLLTSTARAKICAIVAEAFEKGNKTLPDEVQVVRHQLESLSECCKSESGGSCGCAEVNERRSAS